MKHQNQIYAQIFKEIMSIPKGKVSSYGRIAARIPGCTARLVGYVLGNQPAPEDLPWHRIINSQGRISSRGDGYSDELQRVLLEEEGIEFTDGKVDLELFGV